MDSTTTTEVDGEVPMRDSGLSPGCRASDELRVCEELLPSADLKSFATAKYSYDECGRHTRTNVSGAISALWTYTYQDGERTLRIEQDVGPGDPVETTVTEQLSANGKVVSRDTVRLPPAQPAHRYETFDGRGNTTLDRQDNDGDSTWDYEEKSEYNAAGQLVSMVGTKRTVRNTYDARGRITVQEEDIDSNDTVEFTTRFSYRGELEEWTRKETYGTGNALFSVEEQDLDEQGRITEYRWFQVRDGANVLTQKASYSYDGNGGWTRRLDENLDGTADRIETVESKDGRVTHLRIERNGKLREEEWSTYDAKGVLVKFARDANGDGVAETGKTLASECP